MARRLYHLGMSSLHDVARVRLDNARLLFDEFVQAAARQPDAATLRGLEKRFAERLQIQPSYWSQIKSRSRQIGERLARQFERQCHKPMGWMDQPHGAPVTGLPSTAAPLAAERDSSQPQDDDERFIVGLVLSYYRRHPQRARTRLLDLLGEVLDPPAPPPVPVASTPGKPKAGPSVGPAPAKAPTDDDAHSLWLRSQSGVAPLKPRR